MPRTKKLTAKQEQFVHEYMIDLNATEAARRAGYHPKMAAKLVAKSSIQEAIQEAQRKLAERTGVTAARTLEEYALIGFSDIGEVLDFTGTDPRLRPANEIPVRARRAISSVKVKRYTEGTGDDARQVEVTEFKFWSKDAALEKLGRHLGLFPLHGSVTDADGKELLKVYLNFDPREEV